MALAETNTKVPEAPPSPTFAGIPVDSSPTPEPSSGGMSLPSDDASTPEAPSGGGMTLQDNGVTPFPPTPDQAETRASKANFALGKNSPGRDQLTTSILNGTEGDVRAKAVSDTDLEFRKQKLALVNEVIKNSQGPVAPETVDFLMNVPSKDVLSHPDTILETEYGKKYVSLMAAKNMSPDTPVGKALQANPAAAYSEMDVGSYAVARKEIAQKSSEDMEAKVANEGWMPWLGQQAQGLVPFLSWERMQNAVKGTPSAPFLPGDNRLANIEYLYQLPPSEMKEKLDASLAELSKSNPLDAREFANAVVSYGTSDSYMANLFGVSDFAIAGELAAKAGFKVGTALAKGAARTTAVKATAETVAKEATVDAPTTLTIGKAFGSDTPELGTLRQALKDAVQGTEGRTQDIPKQLASMGDIEGSAKVTAFKNLTDALKPKDPFGDAASLRPSVPSLFRPDNYVRDAGSFSREAADRIEAKMVQNSDGLLQSIVNPSVVNRIPDDALIQGISDAGTSLKRDYNYLNDAILDVKYHPAEENLANIHQVSINVGKKDGTLFQTPASAAFHGADMYGLKADDFRVRQQGTGFYIDIPRTIDETSDAVRGALITTENKTPQSLMNTFFGAIRSPEDTVADFQRNNRHALTHGTQELHRLVLDTAKDIGKLSKRDRNDLQRVLVANRDQETVSSVGGTDKLQRGYFYQSLGEFETNFKKLTGKMPSEKQAQAYFSYVQLNDYDWVVRNLSLYRDKARMGLESFKLPFTENVEGKSVNNITRAFDGKVIDRLPWDNPEDANILMHNASGSSLIRKAEFSDPAKRVDLENLIKDKGWKIIQVANPVEKPLSGVAKTQDTINFVISKEAKQSRLTWKQIDYKPGGHIEYPQPWFVKQPTIRRISQDISEPGSEAGKVTREVGHVYEGDKTIFNFSTEAEARKYAARMDEARGMLRDSKPGLGEFLERNLPFSENEFRNFFAKDEQGESILHLDDPIRHTTSGKTVVDMHKDIPGKYLNFRDDIRSPYNLYQNIDKKYAGSRDIAANTVREGLGTDENPLYKLEQAKTLDPLSTMNRAMAGVMRNRYMADYKISAVEQFMQEFGHTLKVDPNELRTNPTYYLHNPPWDKTVPANELGAAKNSQRAIINLMGQESDIQSKVQWVQSKLMDSIYNKLGQAKADWVNENMLSSLTDPSTFIRSIGFHTKLGFNPLQFMLQAQTLAHLIGVSGPMNALPSIAAGTLMRKLALTASPEIRDSIAGIAHNMGYNKDMFIEAYNELKKTGLFNVEGEHAWRDSVMDPKIFKSTVGTILDAGSVFFNEGERLTRLAGWSAAFREWRLANPEAAITNQVRNEILTRTNTFMVNMTRASSASWQKGVFSIPTQFFAYNARMMEQFWGNRLTPVEKLRAVTTYGAIYGIPTSAAGAFGWWPINESIRSQMLENGENVDSSALTAFSEGLVSLGIKGVMGRDYNFAERYGTNGLNIFRDAFGGDKSALELVGGASGSILHDALGAFGPMYRSMYSAIADDAESDVKYKLDPSDFVDVFRNVSGLNQVIKTAIAINTGKYMSKKEMALTDVTTPEALFMGITGMIPRDLSDAQLMSKSAKDHEEMQSKMQDQITTEYRRALIDLQNNDHDGFDNHMKRAKVYMIAGDFRGDQVGQVFSKAMKDNDTLVRQVEYQFATKNAPASQADQRLQHFLHKDQQ